MWGELLCILEISVAPDTLTTPLFNVHGIEHLVVDLPRNIFKIKGKIYIVEIWSMTVFQRSFIDFFEERVYSGQVSKNFIFILLLASQHCEKYQLQMIADVSWCLNKQTLAKINHINLTR